MLTAPAPSVSKSLPLVLAVTAVASVFLPLPSARSGVRFEFRPLERCFMKKINYMRIHRGLQKLRWDRQLTFVARRHARKLARRRSIWHDPRLGLKVTRWRELAQNTGRGFGCRSLFRVFWRSEPHRSNILGPWRFVGVGVRRRHGEIFVQQVFESHTNPGNVFGYP